MLRRPSYFYRNDRAGELLELFLVAAITSLLAVRFYLHLAHYPSLGGRSLHVAHILPGGFLMAAALVLCLAFLGSRVQRLASIIGGIGFGLFVDELGKFVTRDNNYFFRPTVALIYLIFVLLFVLFRSLSGHKRLSRQEYLLNAVMLTEEAVINDLDEPERNRALAYLHSADPDHPLVMPLRHALQEITPNQTDEGSWIGRLVGAAEKWYRLVISLPLTMRIIEAVFVLKAAIFLIDVGSDIGSVLTTNVAGRFVVVSGLQFVSSAVSALIVVAGVIAIRRSRLKAYELFSISVLIDLFITQFFSFYSHQFSALPGFFLNVLLYIALRFALRQERRVSLRTAKA